MTGDGDDILDRRWPEEGLSRVPYWACSDEAVFRREMERIFCGPAWAYVGLACEVPEPGDFRQSSIGNRPVVMTRDLAMLTLWPNLIVQQQSNTLAMRHLVPRSANAFELVWTFFGYGSDDEAMVTRRLRQANLMGPAGFVSVDDSGVMKLSQDGIRPSPDASGVLEMGGREWDDQDHIVTESTIRGFYQHYREMMGF